MNKSELKVNFVIIDTWSLEDISDRIETFTIDERNNFRVRPISHKTKMTIQIEGLEYELINKRTPSRNKVYSVKLRDKNGEIHRMMEVTDKTIKGRLPKAQLPKGRLPK